jgi:hypothetical protein
MTRLGLGHAVLAMATAMRYGVSPARALRPA